ncbi:MAG: serine/threonine-protein kinase [Candidatus Solibacter sp.]
MRSEWDLAKELFAKCMDLDAAQRRAAMDAAPEAVRREVESLLAAEDSADAFLGGTSDSKAPATPLGPYRLIEKIGEGGMGTVWEAERADGQFEMRAAVKIIREHFDTDANVERFRVERQLLAQLAHPNIARLLDGGTTPGGLPYLVMELIEGSRIDTWVRERCLTADSILRLFLPVCDAVAYANQRSILHRDLKPANILVNSEGIPKLVDFGIAKAVGQDAPATATMYRAATPVYASPEHLTGGRLTAASDVYSLGVTLYELLTGAQPYAGTSGSLPELVRAVCEVEPPRPSRLAPSVPAAIDSIIAKAMHKDPARRYPGARDLAADIERHLNAQPVEARADGPGYRVARFLRSRRTAATAATVAFALGAAAWSAWSYFNLRRFDGRSVAVVGINQHLDDASLAWLEHGLTETLTVSLLQSGAFRVLSTERVQAAAQGKTAREAAQALRADLYVEGALIKAPPKIRLDLRVIETAGGRVVLARSFEASSAEAVFTLADQAAFEITSRLTTTAPVKADSKKLLTGNSEALRLYEEGRIQHGKWNLPRAAERFRKAAATDPEFAMAWAGIAQTISWWDRPGARGAIHRASDIAAARGLPKLPVQLIQGLRLYFDARLDESAELLRALGREFPMETDPLFWEGMTQTYTFRHAEARATFDRVTRVDPTHALGWLMLAENSGLDGAGQDARRAADQYCRTIGETADNCLALRGDVHLLAGEWDSAIAQYRASSITSAVMPAAVAWVRGNPGDTFRRLANVSATNPKARLVEGNARAASGDFAGAIAQYERSAKLFNGPAMGYLQLLKAAEILFELGKPDGVLAMTARHDNAWAPGLSAIAYLVQGDKTAAETEFATMRAALTPLVGSYLAGRTEEFHRLLAAFYRGDHPAVAAAAATLPRRFRLLAALPVARSLLELGRLPEAGEYLDFSWRARLSLGGPEIFEEQSGLRVILTEFYQARLAEAQGRKDDARRWAAAFLGHFPGGAAPLAQVREATRMMPRL